MADTALTLAQTEDIFRGFTLNMLRLNPTDPNGSRVRITYPPTGSPAWKRNDDVAFIAVTHADDAITQQVDISYSSSTTNTMIQSASYTRVIQVTWTFYGPNSYNDADIVRSGLYRSPLLYSPLALVTNVPAAFRLPELFNGQWWERVTFSAKFNELVVRASDVNLINSADVQIIPNR